jgi:protein phosphatase
MTSRGSFRINYAQRSDAGRRRRTNQDTSTVHTVLLPHGDPVVVAAVADGMGGAQAGAEASQLAIHTAIHTLRVQLRHRFPPTEEAWSDLLCRALDAANRTVHARSLGEQPVHGMGTTLLVSVLVGRRVYIAHIGDSRAYVVKPARRKPQILQLTADHTVAAELVKRGDLSYADAATHPQRHHLARSIGPEQAIEPQIIARTLRSGERLLLCSDGLPLHVSDNELARTISDAPTPQAACDHLVQIANARGGRDNITVVVLAADPTPADTASV